MLCMLCYAMLCYAMLCYAMLCYAMLCYAMLCYATLRYAMLCTTVSLCSCGAPLQLGGGGLWQRITIESDLRPVGLHRQRLAGRQRRPLQARQQQHRRHEDDDHVGA